MNLEIHSLQQNVHHQIQNRKVLSEKKPARLIKLLKLEDNTF